MLNRKRKLMKTLIAFATSIFAISCSSSGINTTLSPTLPGGPCRSGPTLASGFTLKEFCPPADPGPGGVIFAASGEELALKGYEFPPVNPGDVAFVDGWRVHFTRMLTTVGRVTLSSNPDFLPGDQSKTGPVVADASGPWAVDLARSDASNLPGKGGPEEQAVPLVSLVGQSNGKQFDAANGTRYAFGFNTVAASASAQNVNLDEAALADYEAMTKQGCTTFYAGVATFKGDKTDAACYPESRKSWPDVVKFNFCFKSPTTYINCQNPDNDGRPLADEESQRGIAFQVSRSVIAQITIHTDHPFWEGMVHDAPAHFDQFAARVVGQTPGAEPPSVTLEMTKDVPYIGYTDAAGNPIDWRYCIKPATGEREGHMSFEPGSLPRAIGGDPATGLRDYYDFATYNQSTQGHLNSDGLCAVARDYPPPYVR